MKQNDERVEKVNSSRGKTCFKILITLQLLLKKRANEVYVDKKRISAHIILEYGSINKL